MYTKLELLEDPLESVAEAFFSCPPSYMYSVKATGERFRSFEADHKKAYQGFLEKNFYNSCDIFLTLSSVICINKHVLNFANFALLCVAKSLATLGCMHILTYNIFVHQSGGRVARAVRAGFAGENLHKIQF